MLNLRQVAQNTPLSGETVHGSPFSTIGFVTPTNRITGNLGEELCDFDYDGSQDDDGATVNPIDHGRPSDVQAEGNKAANS